MKKAEGSLRKFLTVIFILPFFSISAQTGSVIGKVISDKAQPITGANLIISGTTYGDASDLNGNFEIKNVPFGVYNLEASCIGYGKRTIRNISVGASSKPLTIVLREAVIETAQVIVSASKYEQRLEDITASTTIIQPDYINRKNFISFDDMLRYIPGVQMNLEQVSIRGSSGYSKGVGARVLVAINGIPLYAGDNGDVVWELIPLSDIERVEVIKGPASSLYGSSAIGGVINIITKAKVQSPVTYFKSYLGAYDKPSHDLWKWDDNYRTFYGIELTHSGSNEKLGYTLSLKKFDNMSYRQNDYFKRYLGHIKLSYSFTPDNYILFFSNYLYSNRGNFLYWKDSRNALVPKDEENGNYVLSNRIFNGLIYHHKFNENFTSEAKGSFYRTSFDGYGLEVTSSVANLFRGEFLTNYFASDNLIITSGLEASYSDVNSNIFSNTHFYGAGAYLQAEYKGIKNLIATAGLRFDYIKIDTISGKNAVTPRLGLNYKLNNDIILRASIGTGFRAPTPAEVFTSAAVGGGVGVKENPNLTSETSLSFEFGVQYKIGPGINFDAALFQTEYNNFIEANLTNEGDIQFINLSKARIQGIETILDWSLIPEELKVTVGYNYLWARDIEKNRSMKYRPRNSFYAQVKYSPGQFDFGIDFRHWSRIEEIDNALVEPPLALVVDGDKRVPVYVTDITAGYNFLIWNIPAKIYLNARNLFNYNYVEFIGNIAPIRNVSLSTEIYF
ncbi:MAG TPA: TonB-dependent receptor [Melioribacteraceae bacterium]|nr:TonB-dependent receptor [Melioribacteraceae bacterium]